MMLEMNQANRQIQSKEYTKFFNSARQCNYDNEKIFDQSLNYFSISSFELRFQFKQQRQYSPRNCVRDSHRLLFIVDVGG
jgi:hypothetical protein